MFRVCDLAAESAGASRLDPRRLGKIVPAPLRADGDEELVDLGLQPVAFARQRHRR